MQPPDQLHQDAAPIGQMRLVSLDLAVRVLPSSLECNYVTELAVVWAWFLLVIAALFLSEFLSEGLEFEI